MQCFMNEYVLLEMTLQTIIVGRQLHKSLKDTGLHIPGHLPEEPHIMCFGISTLCGLIHIILSLLGFYPVVK
jgi:hypothetical protein